LAKRTNILDFALPEIEASVIDTNIGPGPIYYKGWIKFFKFKTNVNRSRRPRGFF